MKRRANLISSLLNQRLLLRVEKLESRDMLSVNPVPTTGSVLIQESTEYVVSASSVIESSISISPEVLADSKVHEQASTSLGVLVAAWHVVDEHCDEIGNMWQDEYDASPVCLETTDEMESPAPVLRSLEVPENYVITENSDLDELLLSSGDSGGTLFTVCLSGDMAYCYEGDSVVIVYSGLPSDCIITAEISYLSTVIVDYNSILSSVGNIGSCGTLSIQTLDDYLRGEDKVLVVDLHIMGGIQIDNLVSITVPVLERPEFISNGDVGVAHVSYNDDSYFAYVDSYASAGSLIHVKGKTEDVNGVIDQLSVEGAIKSKGSNRIRYELKNPSPFFGINSITGSIHLLVNAKNYVDVTNSYQCSLTIRAYRLMDDVCNSGGSDSGGNGYADEASVTISFCRWNIVRASNQAIASVAPTDGCTLATLAATISLDVAEYRNWLTVNSSATSVELFSGEYRNIEALGVNDVLASSPLNNGVFAIPNTIFAAYCFNPALRNSGFGWTLNISGLTALGFKVVVFNNSDYLLTQDAAAIFLSQIAGFSQNKFLHGVYFVGHGNNGSFGPLGGIDPSSPLCYSSEWGPGWSVDYATIESSLTYHLGAAIIHACHSTSGAYRLATIYAIKGSANSTAFPARIFWAGLWGYYVDPVTLLGYYGGAQGTWRYDYTLNWGD